MPDVTSSVLPSGRQPAHGRGDGWQAGVVERWVAHADSRIDLGGGIDVLA